MKERTIEFLNITPLHVLESVCLKIINVAHISHLNFVCVDSSIIRIILLIVDK